MGNYWLEKDAIICDNLKESTEDKDYWIPISKNSEKSWDKWRKSYHLWAQSNYFSFFFKEHAGFNLRQYQIDYIKQLQTDKSKFFIKPRFSGFTTLNTYYLAWKLINSQEHNVFLFNEYREAKEQAEICLDLMIKLNKSITVRNRTTIEHNGGSLFFMAPDDIPFMCDLLFNRAFVDEAHFMNIHDVNSVIHRANDQVCCYSSLDPEDSWFSDITDECIPMNHKDSLGYDEGLKDLLSPIYWKTEIMCQKANG